MAKLEPLSLFSCSLLNPAPLNSDTSTHHQQHQLLANCPNIYIPQNIRNIEKYVNILYKHHHHHPQLGNKHKLVRKLFSLDSIALPVLITAREKQTNKLLANPKYSTEQVRNTGVTCIFVVGIRTRQK